VKIPERSSSDDNFFLIDAAKYQLAQNKYASGAFAWQYKTVAISAASEC
jgi:hypothetical protein